jgi:hypothetical protein
MRRRGRRASTARRRRSPTRSNARAPLPRARLRRSSNACARGLRASPRPAHPRRARRDRRAPPPRRDLRALPALRGRAATDSSRKPVRLLLVPLRRGRAHTTLRGMYALGGGAQALADTLAESITPSGGTPPRHDRAPRSHFDARGRAESASRSSAARGRGHARRRQQPHRLGHLRQARRRRAHARGRARATQSPARLGRVSDFPEPRRRGRAPPPFRARARARRLARGRSVRRRERALHARRRARLGRARARGQARRQRLHLHRRRAVVHLPLRRVRARGARTGARSKRSGRACTPRSPNWARAPKSSRRPRRAPSTNARADASAWSAAPRTPDVLGSERPDAQDSRPQPLPHGDTVFPGNGLAPVTHSALIVANEIAPPGCRSR